METRWLEDAIVLIEEGNLSRAAARRNVTQPAFSRRIRSLEEWTGVRLLERHANGVEIGRALQEGGSEIRAVLERLEWLRARLARGEPTGRSVTLVAQHALSMAVFPDICALEAAWNWRLRTLNRDECVSVLLRAEADLLLCYEAREFPPMPFDDSVRRAVWRRDTLIPVIGASFEHGLEADGTLAAGMPLVSYPEASHFGRLVAASAPADPWRSPDRRRIESAFTLGIAEMVRKGLGAGWVPHALAASLLAGGEMISLAPAYGSIPLDICLFGRVESGDAMILMDRL